MKNDDQDPCPNCGGKLEAYYEDFGGGYSPHFMGIVCKDCQGMYSPEELRDIVATGKNWRDSYECL